MQKFPGKASSTLLSGIAALMLVPAIAFGDGGSKHSGAKYRVTITNLTPGQPFTPPVVATHSRRTGIFAVGEPSSSEVQAIAENGNNVPLFAALSGDVNVGDVVEGTSPVLPANDPGETGFPNTVSFTIRADRHARYLSFISMLVCTNDGFAGLDSVRLPLYSKTVYAAGYDARSEINTEDFADIVPPCQGLIGVSSSDPGTGESNPLLAEDGVVIPHVGIHGDDDLQSRVHAWTDPVAKIVITRIKY